jgi:hypothetical protein
MIPTRYLAGAITLLLASAVSATAYPTVSMNPSTSLVDVGEIFWVSLEVDGSGDSLACYQIEFTFDCSVIELIGAYEGDLFANSGFQTFFRWETDTPDTQRVLDCLMGGGTYVLGPGVIADLEFEALQEGATPIDYLNVNLADVHRNDILDFGTEDAYVFVGPTAADEIDGDTSSGIGEITRQSFDMMVSPNPFLNETTIMFYNPFSEDCLEIDVYDAAGRKVVGLKENAWKCGLNTVVWDGRSDSGWTVPSGVYFVTLSGGNGIRGREKIIKVR